MLAIALRLAAVAMLSTMFMLVKLAGEAGVSLPELVFWRQAMSVPLIFAVLLASKQVHVLRTRRIRSHAVRAFMGTLGLCCNLAAATLLPLSVGTTLGFTAPLFAVLIAAFALRDPVGKWRWTAVMLGFAGVLVVTRPGSMPIPPLGLAVGLTAGLLVAIISYQVRDLARTEAPIACVFWFALFGSTIAAAALPFYATAHSAWQWFLLLAIGLFGTLAQFLMTSALRIGQVATVVTMDYSALIWATAYGWMIWGHVPTPSIWLGAPLIVAAGLIITYRERLLVRRISPTSAIDEGATEEANLQGT